MLSKFLKQLSVHTGLSEADLLKIWTNAPDRYKVFRIRKRSGGWREIAQPARELKLVQRALVEILLSQLPVHDAATAYVRGRSILDNATPHRGDTPILKLDFRDFFPSILAEDWEAYCAAHDVIQGSDVHLTSRMLFRRPRSSTKLRLSIGAPSSPMLSNVLMYEFDDAIDKIAKDKGIAYTRYADDLTFSGQRIGMLQDMVRAVKKTLRNQSSPKLRLNQSKTVFVTMASKRTVTGVVLANDGTAGIGRGRKRELSAAVHHAKMGKLEKSELKELCGHLAFANAIDPDFLKFLAKKYGSEVIRAIQSAVELK
ncbi:retron St85 family RNA-directed DNA polymerase [Sphingorhabdus sp.]|nr:RNA-directed DNA polymerase [Sphingomonadales bacterium]